MIFKYRGYDKNGKKVNAKIEAGSLDEAKKQLRFSGVIFTSVKEEKAFFSKRGSLQRKKKISYTDLAVISRDLSIYIRSGITIVNAITLASNQYKEHKHHNLFFKSIASLLQEGKNFFQALDLQNVYALPPFFKQSIKVSENGGILGDVLLELSHFLKEQDQVTKQIKNALAYPSFIFFISIAIVIFMISFIVPKITSIFEELDQALPPVTLFVINMGDFFENYWPWLLQALIAIAAAYILLRKFSFSFAKNSDRLKLKIPIAGKIIYKNEMGRFSYVAHVLLKSGVPFAKTINLSSSVLDNLYIKEILQEASERVVEGAKLSDALIKSKRGIDRGFIQAIALGEETSKTTEMLSNISELYFEENKDKTTLLLALLEPALMLFVGGVVGFIITAMLLPIFSINIGAF